MAADGVYSRMRQLIGRNEQPLYTGQMTWRAFVPRPEWGTCIHTFSGIVHNSGLIPISDSQAYCFVTENTDDTVTLPDETLADAMRAILAPFTGKLAEVRELITDPGTVVRRPVRTILVDAPWHKGRIVLLGDAAHAPSPQLTSGTALAVEDALVLVEELGRASGVPAALDAYSARRAGRGKLVVELSLEIANLERTGRYPETYPLHDKAHRVLAAAI